MKNKPMIGYLFINIFIGYVNLFIYLIGFLFIYWIYIYLQAHGSNESLWQIKSEKNNVIPFS